MGESLRFSVAEEVRADEVVDDRLVGGIDDLELDTHAHAAVAPRHVSSASTSSTRHAEAHLDLGAAVQRAGRPIVMPLWLRLRSAAAMVLPNRILIGMPSTTRGRSAG
jgi:hypothetical protein